jgi:hypothetical protein
LTPIQVAISPMREKINTLTELMHDLSANNGDEEVVITLSMAVQTGEKMLSGDDDIAEMDTAKWLEIRNDWHKSADELIEIAQNEQIRPLETLQISNHSEVA